MPAPGEEPDRSLPREKRLTRSIQFREAYDQGRKWIGHTMVLFLRESDDGALRLGVVSSRKVGKAHDRNRARRMLRTAWRTHRHRFRGAVDVVLVARRAAATAPLTEIEQDLLKLVALAGLLNPEAAR